ncbi:hypothetical protein [Streptomyces daliensis]|uniref:Uncharacterized protein n=1 Tax=Streptomyces daliensis TaxID=299421 RepID=A0A8T4J0B8_9ACTN|nr:hypothetical protein [Streptomyces daliensis]
MSAPTSSPTGLALVLLLVGSLVAMAASIGALVAGEQRLLLVASVGFFVQVLGWRRHSGRSGGAR